MGGREKTISQFDEWSETYEEGIWSYYFSLANKKILELLKGRVSSSANILDVGCGPGLLIEQLAQNFTGEIVGLDISPKMIEFAKKRCSDFKNVEFINTDIESAGTNKKFDAIVCMNSFHHYNDHVNVLKDLGKLLNEDGTIILLDPHRDNLLRRFWTFLLKNIFDEKDVVYFTRKQLRGMAKEASLSIIRQDKFLYFALITEFKKAD